MSVPRRLATADPPGTSTTSALDVRSMSLTVIAAAAVMYVLNWAQEVFIPIVLSILISYALEPAVTWLTRLRLHRMVASALVVLGVTGGVAATGYALSDDVAAVVARMPDAAQTLRRTFRRDFSETLPLQHVEKAAQELQKTADEAAGRNPTSPGVQRVQIEEPTFNLRQYVSWGSAGALAFAGQALLIFFFVFFLLSSDDLFKRKLVKIAGPSLEKRRVTIKILDDINTQIERFLFVRLVTGVVVAAATWIAFRIIGVEQAGVWALMAGLFNTLPYFGPVIVAAGTAVVGLVQFGTLAMALYVSGITLVITSIEGWLLTPWLTSRSARTNEVAVFIALIFWSFVWGIWGTLLAVPMLVAVKAYCDRIDGLKPVGELLSE
jgi:predicted PurR-regulated permease PerM